MRSKEQEGSGYEIGSGEIGVMNVFIFSFFLSFLVSFPFLELGFELGLGRISFSFRFWLSFCLYRCYIFFSSFLLLLLFSFLLKLDFGLGLGLVLA